ncbi:hypothetical protein LTR91_006313 [Friedmanniomyces endolithicus]|uniref:Phosphoribosylaminoimidazole-succinocarboxamide synthase n=1 Tax=Friedmanniomyces endolithicus TaxID=329885 RepID=A0AAN6KST1_9PEZI|nr:hypothetical protein LTR94_012734 [Friedmanniomyces endolithicus]KAK0772522.1 hypothetical protein LTR75_017386 [Friedmanniomyces endolithicus]KAK0807456.1 hypothetical protein LTR59_003299 [Friedmanniomyces endolithicus]KAK0809264.1 hypothetical protein LTR38_004333 [Friedmanniomyces endolithicus]KAK0863154.1 hypothetical protein LTR87_016321 [Friedmanniomyces endolithicus]
MSHLSPQDATGPLSASTTVSMRHTNVSTPSLITTQPSLQSVAASEDYYSLSNPDSGSSTDSGDQLAQARSNNTIHRYRTPPSRYRTPLQSRDYLPVGSGAAVGGSAGVGREELEGDGVGGAEAVGGGGEEPAFRKTPMRGQCRRRQHSVGESSSTGMAEAAPVAFGGVRRKPVPSTVMEGGSVIDPSLARSSVAMDLAREEETASPPVDDTPFIRFALEQLTRDEEVRGSRRYRGLGSGVDDNYPYLVPGGVGVPGTVGREEEDRAYSAPAVAVPAAVAAREEGLQQRQSQGLPQQWRGPQAAPMQQQWRGPPEAAPTLPVFDYIGQAEQKPFFAQPPPRNPNRVSELPAEPVQPYRQQRLYQQPPRDLNSSDDTRLLPVAPTNPLNAPLTFLPATLRPILLLPFLLLLLLFLACLLFCAIYSLLHPGIWAYGSFGDARYFLFEYLPTLLGIMLFFWTIQIEVAVYRIAPFIAMASPSSSSRARIAGARLPMVPRGFVLPYFGHFGAGQGVVGFFVVVAWLQAWTIPLLASSFNVYFDGAPGTGRWLWIATQGAVWAVIALYLLLAVAVVMLLGWLGFGKKTTGLKWDPRSLADLIVLLERSNALDEAQVDGGEEPAMLGYWRTNARPNEVFHTFGVAGKPARRYGVQDGRIQEKSPLQMPVSRFSTDPAPDLESGDHEQRHSREKMLPKPTDGSEDDNRASRHGSALPWFLRPSLAALWAIIALVLLVAFLVVSYLPRTRVSAAFAPDVPAPVNTKGFSVTNFLYSFLPALLGTLCLLFWLDVEYAYRRLQSYTALANHGGNGEEGELAERSLLLAYPALPPGLATASALANAHWRLAFLSFISLLAAALPVLGGGVFWAQFYVPTQKTRISAHMPAYYALTVFATLYALAWLAVFPGKGMRRACEMLGGNQVSSFADVVALVRQSRVLDDVAFRAPVSKTGLVTRLLGAEAGAGIARNEEAGVSTVSVVVDSVRGFGRARQGVEGGVGGVQRFGLARFVGRDGGEHFGIDRVRE